MTQMPSAMSAIIDEYWADWLGCAAETLAQPGRQLVVSHQTDPNRIAIFERGESTLVRLSPDHLNDAQQSLGEPKAGLDVANHLASALSNGNWTVSPSEKIFYLDEATFRPCPHPDVRPLDIDDEHRLTEMHQGCTLEEQRAGEVSIDHPAIFGAFAQGKIVAAASFIDQSPQISDVGVLVHRDFRGRGLGRAVVSGLCEWGLENGRIVQYCRLCTNLGSARIADSLGFTEYGRLQILTRSFTPFS